MTKKQRKKAPRKGKSAIWGGRFESGPADVMEAINASIDFDRRLYAQDIAGSRAHCAMLMDKGIISPKDGNAILAGLDRIQAEIEGGGFRFERALEDIHMNIEARLARLVGPAAGRLHTARSRNDQVATDLRLWVRETLDSFDLRLARLQAALIEHAERHAATVMPGFTHSQAAQPVTLGHHLLAYVEMFGRDRGRVADCRRRANECPLGAVALAGTAFPIDRRASARALGFARPSANSIDAVSDRDFVLEFLSAGAILAVHLSRLGEEIVLWCSDGFRFVRLSDAYTTGSSVMPQKRNPDAAELVRAKAGRIIGALTGLLVVLKALPLAYGKDLQEDKEPAFDAADSLALSLDAMTGMIEDAAFDAEAMRAAAAAKGYATATDLADWLVRELNMPFRKAHEAAGRMVRRAEGRGCALEDLPLAEMRAIVPEIEDGVFAVLGVENSVKSRTSFGGTAPANVRRAVRAARKRFLRT